MRHGDPQEIQRRQGHGHQQHAHRIRGRKEHGDHKDYQDRNPPFLEVRLDSENADAMQEQGEAPA